MSTAVLRASSASAGRRVRIRTQFCVPGGEHLLERCVVGGARRLQRIALFGVLHHSDDGAPGLVLGDAEPVPYGIPVTVEALREGAIDNNHVPSALIVAFAELLSRELGNAQEAEIVRSALLRAITDAARLRAACSPRPRSFPCRRRSSGSSMA